MALDWFSAFLFFFHKVYANAKNYAEDVQIANLIQSVYPAIHTSSNSDYKVHT